MSDIGLVIKSIEQKKHARRVGLSMIVLGIFVAVFFTRSPRDAGFILSPAFTLVIPSQQFAQVIAVALVGAGAFQLYRGWGKTASVLLAIGTALFVISFLAWASAVAAKSQASAPCL